MRPRLRFDVRQREGVGSALRALPCRLHAGANTVCSGLGSRRSKEMPCGYNMTSKSMSSDLIRGWNQTRTKPGGQAFRKTSCSAYRNRPPSCVLIHSSKTHRDLDMALRRLCPDLKSSMIVTY
jgi:hypothetical protein